MTAYNRRAEVAATPTNTMGRQKLGSSPLQPSRAACRKETDRQRQRERERERERESVSRRMRDEQTNDEMRRENVAGWPTNLHYLQRRSATVSRWLVSPVVGWTDTRKRLNYFRLATKLSGPAKRPPKRSFYLPGRIFARTPITQKTLPSAGIRRR